MKDNIDLRILEKRIKLFKSLTVLFTVLSPLSLLGIGLKYPYSYCFVALCVLLFAAAVTFAVFMHKTQNQIKRTVAYLQNARDNIVATNNVLTGFLNGAYSALDYKKCGELGFVNFTREGITFAAEGKFVIQKDFKRIKGNHLALQICGTKMVSTPEEYDDVLDYESNLFKINIGYFDDCPLAEENDSGLIIPEEDLTGKEIFFASNKSYFCYMETAEEDDIDYGEFVISEHTEDSLTISFKCMVKCGAADVVYGKVKLIRDSQDSDEMTAR